MSVAGERIFGGGRPLRGTLRVPGDKSISHRAVLLAALAPGTSRIDHLATGEDVAATLRAVEALGVRVKGEPPTRVTLRSGGLAGFAEPDDVLDCGNSGTTMRILAGVVAGCEHLCVLTGDTSLRRRPMARVTEPLRTLGAHVEGRSEGAHAPLVIRGGDLHGARIELPVASAQVKSAVLLAGLAASGTTTVIEPGRSRDHTERMLRALGVPLHAEATALSVTAAAPEPFEAPMPGDPSSSAFFVVGALITPGSELTIENVSVNPTRTGYIDVLRRMGATVEVVETDSWVGEPVGSIVVRAGPLHATTIEADEMPNVQDEIPVLAVAAAFAEGMTEIRGAAELRVKESDRIGAVSQELAQLGVGVETWGDGLAIRGGQPRPAPLKSHGDHRMAMAGAIAAHALDGESAVRGWECVASSYPEFIDHLSVLTEGS